MLRQIHESSPIILSGCCSLSQEKKVGQLRKYPNQPMVGFRYVGMSWSSYVEGDEQPIKVGKDKSWGAKMPVEDSGRGLVT